MDDQRMTRSRSTTTRAVLIIGLIATVAVWLFGAPLAQDPAYHDFADQRALLQLPHAANVLSNVAFCVVGAWGGVLLVGHRQSRCFLGAVYGTFFLGLFATGLGSAYYHWWPDNATLIWDRLPMTIGFTAFTTLVLAERYSDTLARSAFPWLLLAGVLSVAYWGWVDDLRAYVLIQFAPMVILPLVIWRYPGPGTRWLWLTVACYVLAKLLELTDDQVLTLTDGFVSGHTLKHLAAAAGAAMLVGKVKTGAVGFMTRASAGDMERTREWRIAETRR